MLRKILFLLMLIMMVNSIAFAEPLTSIFYDGEEHPYTAKELTLMLNNDKFTPQEGQMPPIILNNRTLVPVREVFEYLGGTVNWDGDERRVDVSFEDTKISLWINNLEATKNNEKLTLDVPAKIINNKTMVPVRFISENADLVVGWDGESYTVDVKYPKANITNIGFATIDGVNCLVAKADKKITGYKYFSLPKDENNPLRLVLDVENCNFTFDTTNASFEAGILQGIRFGNQGNDVNRIVLDLREDSDYVVTLSKDRLKLYFAMAEEFVAPEDVVSQPTTNIEQNSGEITPEATNIVSSSEPTEAVVSNESANTNESASAETNISESSPVEATSGDSEKPTDSQDEKTSGDNSGEVVTPSDNKDDVITVLDNSGENIIINSPVDEDFKYDTTISSIKYSASSKRVKIKYSGKIKYNDSIYTNPNKVVIDIENAKLDTSGPQEIDVKNFIITQIRFSQYTKTSVRVVLDLSSRGEYKIYKRSSELQIEVEESRYKNIKYKKNTSNSQITLQNVKLDDLTYSQREDMFRYIVKYDIKEYDFGSGALTPDDKFIKSITVLDGVITIADTGHKSYAIKQSSSNVVITVREKEDEPEVIEVIPALSGDSGDLEEPSGEQEISIVKKKVVIDVGHGGTDPGASNGDYHEKDFNLNIAKELYKLLKEREDIEVVIDRTTDIYLSREDRVAFANNNNPDFIVSCHINAVENKSYSGTMVLYYNNETESDYGDITSEESARIIQKKLVNALNTIDRGIVKREDLHILSKTPCPSVLCEVCFISNDAELQQLKTKAFQNKAAEAIYEGVLEVLKEM